MADPLTWTLIGVGVVGGLTAGVGAFSQTQAQQEQAEFNAAMAARNAAQEELNAAAALNRANAEATVRDAEADAEIANIRRRNAAILAENRAMVGMTGFDGTGSTLLLAIDNAENAEMAAREALRSGRYEADLLRYSGELSAFEHRQNAAAYRAESSFAGQQASSANPWLSGSLAALSGALSGATAGASLFSSYQKNEQASLSQGNDPGWSKFGGGLENPFLKTKR